MIIKKNKSKKQASDVILLDEEQQEIHDLVAEDLDRYINNHISLLKRELYIGPITNPGAMRFHKNLMLLEALSPDPITIHIHSDGGFCDAGWLIYDALMASRCHIRGICWGICASMATTILQACDERILKPNVSFMIHDGSDVLRGAETVNAKTPVTYGAEAKYQLQLGYDVLHQRSIFGWEEMQSLVGGPDCYLQPEEVVLCGWADRVEGHLKTFKKPSPPRGKKTTIKKLIKERGLQYIERIKK